MVELFVKGGPMMWPLFITSLVALTLINERLLFFYFESRKRRPETVQEMLSAVEKGELEQALRLGQSSQDRIARMLTYGLQRRDASLSGALLQAANSELKRFNQGIFILDTVVTLAPLLGLLGTVTGMIRAFAILGGRELEAPAVITGSIAEALIATAFGLGVAILALIPYNAFNAHTESVRHELEDAGTRLELILNNSNKVLT